MQAGFTSAQEGRTPSSDEAFQELLLEFSAAAAKAIPVVELIQLFCRLTRQFFQASGSYFWRCAADEELVGTAADGLMAQQFRGSRLRSTHSAVAVEAVRKRQTVYVNNLDPLRYPMAAHYRARSIMAAPLVVANEVIGAAVYLHDSDPVFFNDDLAAKATILAGQLGTLLEASRLVQVSREEHRRAGILAEVAHALHAVPDPSSVMEGVADRLRVLLRTRLVCILMRENASFTLQAVAAESAQLAASVRARHDRKGLQFAADLAERAVTAGEPITVAIDPGNHALGEFVPAGMLIAAPFRTSRTQGVVLVYPRQEGAFNAEEKSLVAAMAGFGAVAIANAELYGTAQAQATELHRLLEISSELSSIGDLDQFLQQVVRHSSDFLEFGRAFIALLEPNGTLRVRWAADQGRVLPLDAVVPDAIASRILKEKEAFWTDDCRRLADSDPDFFAKLKIRQMLAVPLLGTEAQVLGMFAVLDRLDRAPVSQEDVRRARGLAAHASAALGIKRNLHLSEQHRHRAESLVALAGELNSLPRTPECAKTFVARAAEIMEAGAAALIVNRESRLQTLVFHGTKINPGDEPALLRQFEQSLTRALEQQAEIVLCASTEKLLGTELAQRLGWRDCTVVQLFAASKQRVGILCLANRGKTPTSEDQQLLQAVAGHASIALENARLFTSMERSNRHWMEIFDAMTDFIVVHDERDSVLRVNRSLAEFIGVQPKELIGVNMCALLAVSGEAPVRNCPFCRTTENTVDEYVHPVLQRTYLVSTSRVHGATDEGLQTIHVLKDITDRREAERRYRELFDNIQEGLFFSTDDGHFIEVNDAMVRILGYSSREELLQVEIPTQVYFSPEQRLKSQRILQESGGALRNHEVTLRRRDGSPVHVLINAFSVRDAQGRISQYRGLMLDITGLKNYQTELQRERDFSGKILNNTQSLILVVDTAGLVSYANRRWQDLGYAQVDLLGRPLQDLVASSSVESLSEALRVTLSGQQVDNLELHVLRGEGRVGQFSVNLSPMRDEQGIVISMVVVMTDVTDSASLQAKLVHAEKLAAVGQLVSGVAHEVNNPLTAILGFADLLMENPELPEPAKKDLRVILQEAQRTKQIVQNLLSFARQMPPQRKPVQLNMILRRTVQLRAYDLHSHGIEVAETLDEHLPPVVGDAQQLQQVFLNILNNAYDAVRETGRPGRIEIMTARGSTFVEVSFRDNGPGVSHPDRIFDPFFTTKEVGKGTGLGLSICYGIVREHGGEILCHNNVGGEGASFIVRLPAVSEAAPLGAAAGVTVP